MKKLNLIHGIIAMSTLTIFSNQARAQKTENIMEVGTITVNVGVGVGRPSGRKRTEPRPRDVLASPEIGTLDVTEVLLNGASTKTAGSAMLPPARIAN